MAEKNIAEQTPEEILRSTGLIVEDPVTKFLVNSWREVVLTAVAVIAAVIGYQQFESTRTASLRSAADTFSKVRSEYETISDLKGQVGAAQVEVAGAKTEEEGKKAKEKVERLTKDLSVAKDRVGQTIAALGDARDPYPRLADLYRGLVAVNFEEFDVAKQELSKTNWSSVPADSAERFYSEMGAVALGRALLGVKGSESDAREMLVKLSTDGVYVNTSAAITLSRIAKTNEEVRAALALLEEIQLKEPSQTDIVVPEIERLKAVSGKS